MAADLETYRSILVTARDEVVSDLLSAYAKSKAPDTDTAAKNAGNFKKIQDAIDAIDKILKGGAAAPSRKSQQS